MIWRSPLVSAIFISLRIHHRSKVAEVIEIMFSEAIECRNEGDLQRSSEILLDIVSKYEGDSRLITVYTVLGGVLFDQSRFIESLHYYKKAQALNRGLEIVSLGIYLNYVELERYDEAIAEMDQYLTCYHADAYLITLKELLGDLKNGFARDHESVIVKWARKYNVLLY